LTGAIALGASLTTSGVSTSSASSFSTALGVSGASSNKFFINFLVDSSDLSPLTLLPLLTYNAFVVTLGSCLTNSLGPAEKSNLNPTFLNC